MMEERNSNIELLRIFAMAMVVMLHANEAPCPSESFLRIFCYQLCIVAVDVFIIISGWFSIKPSINKYLSIVFTVSFYTFLIAFIFLSLNRNVGSLKNILLYCTGMGYWFLPCYFILFSLAPVLNSFVNVDKKCYLSVLLMFFAFQLLYGRFGDRGGFLNGYSAISFIGLYLLARYARVKGSKIFNFPLTLFSFIYIINTE